MINAAGVVRQLGLLALAAWAILVVLPLLLGMAAGPLR